jgi:hypothetical protein
MGLKRGISILDLIGLPPGAGTFRRHCDQLWKIASSDYTTATSDGVHSTGDRSSASPTWDCRHCGAGQSKRRC